MYIDVTCLPAADYTTLSGYAQKITAEILWLSSYTGTAYSMYMYSGLAISKESFMVLRVVTPGLTVTFDYFSAPRSQNPLQPVLQLVTPLPNGFLQTT